MARRRVREGVEGAMRRVWIRRREAGGESVEEVWRMDLMSWDWDWVVVQVEGARWVNIWWRISWGRDSMGEGWWGGLGWGFRVRWEIGREFGEGGLAMVFVYGGRILLRIYWRE